MLRFAVRRLILLVPILIGLSLLVFLWIRALPVTPQRRCSASARRPSPSRRSETSTGSTTRCTSSTGGTSRRSDRATSGRASLPAARSPEKSRERFPATIELAFGAMIFATFLGIPLGFVAAKRHGKSVDHASLFVSLIGVSIPIFFLAIILKWAFSVELGWLPERGPPGRPHRRRAPDELLRARRDRHWQLDRRLGRHQAFDPAGDRARLHPARDHRAHHARLRPRRAERGLRAYGPSRRASPGRSSTAAMF